MLDIRNLVAPGILAVVAALLLALTGFGLFSYLGNAANISLEVSIGLIIVITVVVMMLMLFLMSVSFSIIKLSDLSKLSAFLRVPYALS